MNLFKDQIIIWNIMYNWCFIKTIYLFISNTEPARWCEKFSDSKIIFNHTNKWYMHNPESIQENEAHELFWDFEIQTDPLI